MPDDRSLRSVVDSVADGEPLDWPVLDSEATDEDDRDLLRQLRIVAQLADAHRAFAGSSSEETTPARGDAVLSRWGRYDLVEKLGRGTFGTVYRAWDPELERYIAVKLLHISDDVTSSLKARVLQEGRAIAKVQHRHVVSIHGVEVHDGKVGLCMELVKGKTLDEVIVAQGTMSAGEAATVGEMVCQALAAVHRAGLVHGDVKARNVMREDGGRIVLMDFGTGHALTRNAVDHRAAIAGTPIYMPPEALTDRVVSAASDIYSTGVLLFHLVTGLYPVEGATIDEVVLAHARKERRFVSDERPDLPASFVRVVEKALAPDPARRYPSASSLLVDLLNAVDRTRVGPEPGPSPWRAIVDRTKNGIGRVVFLASIAVLVVLALGFFSSWAYWYALGVEDGLAREGPLSWLRWGLKSLVAPLVLMAAISLIAFVAMEVVTLVRRVSSVADAALRRVGLAAAGLIESAGLTASAALAGVVLVASMAFAAWVVFGRFSTLLFATLTPIDEATTAALSRLAPGNEAEHTAYRQTLSIAVLAMLFGWGVVLRVASRRGEAPRRALLIGGIVTTAFTLVLLDIPYRVLWQNEAEKVTFNGANCYVVSTRENALRVFCPDRTPRSVLVPLQDKTLTRSGTVENIFRTFSPAAPD